MKLEAYCEAKPYRVTQEWGVHRPEIYSQFGFTDHNGTDFALGHDAALRAPVPLEVYKQGYQPNGGGLYVSLITQHEYDFEDGKRCKVLVDYLHLKEIKCTPGQRLDVGDILAYADNTGFSTGPHTHRQARRVVVTPTGPQTIDTNNANNTFNFDNFLNGKYAEDVKLSQLQQQLQQLVAILAKLLLGRK